MCFGQRLRGSRPRRKIGADTLKPRRALGKTWEQAPTAFEAAQLIKPPALRGVSDSAIRAGNSADLGEINKIVAVNFDLRIFDSRLISRAAFANSAAMSEIQHAVRIGHDNSLGRNCPKQPLLDRS